MSVMIISKNSFNVTQLDSVSSISLSGTTFTIVAGGTTYTYSSEDYRISMIWQ